MFLEFNKGINEFWSMGFQKKNDGKPFEVRDSLGTELLNEYTSVEGEMVPTFKVVKPKEEKGGKK